MIELSHGLPHEKYLAVPAISYSSIKKILESPLDFWADCPWLNPEFKHEESEGMRIGTILHKLVLEGRKAFDDEFLPEITPCDFPGVDFMFKQADYKDYCRNNSLKVGGTNSELIERILRHDSNAQIWECKLTEWENELAHNDLKAIKRDDANMVFSMAEAVERNQFAVDALKGGKEVSFFWDRDDVPVKTRLDCLKIEGDHAVITELKNFSPRKGKPIARQIISTICAYQYDLQAAVNAEAVHLYYGIPYENIRFQAVFVRSGPQNQAFLYEYPGMSSALMHRARNAFNEGAGIYKECAARYKDGERWDMDSQSQQLEDDDFPVWYLEGDK